MHRTAIFVLKLRVMNVNWFYLMYDLLGRRWRVWQTPSSKHFSSGISKIFLCLFHVEFLFLMSHV